MSAKGGGHKRNGCEGGGSLVMLDSITTLDAAMAGRVVVAASHGGIYPGWCAARGGVRAVIFNDAGGGLEGAGYASLPYCEGFGMAAATVDAYSCRIGDVADMYRRGIVSHANAPARACGVRPGQECARAAELLRAAPQPTARPDGEMGELRSEILLPGARRRLILVDSASLVRSEDAGQVVVTGSHGGLLGGDPLKALRADAFAAVFNDAGGGADDAGFGRLPALDERGIAAVTVAAATARIGDARSHQQQGVISRVNTRARALGAAEGMALRDATEFWCCRCP